MWERQLTRLDKAIRGKLQEGLSRLSDLTGNKFDVFQRGFPFKATVVRGRGLLLVLVSEQDCRPSHEKLIGLVEGSGRLVFPAEVSEDLMEVADRLGASSSQLATVYDLVTWHYGLVVRDEPSVLVRNSAHARELGFEPEFERLRCGREGEQLFWRRWGGELYSLSFESRRVEEKLLDSSLGDFEMIPLPLLR